MRSVSVALALLLAAGAVSAAETASQRTKKQRKAPAGQELAAPAGLEQPSALLTRTPVQQPFAARTVVEPARADTVTTGWISVTDREGTPVTRDLEKGARRAGILPIVLPPFIPPASPIR